MRSFHVVGMIRSFGSRMARSRASVSSCDAPMATMNSSTSGRADRMDSSNGKPSMWPLRMNVKALIFMVSEDSVGRSGPLSTRNPGRRHRRESRPAR